MATTLLLLNPQRGLHDESSGFRPADAQKDQISKKGNKLMSEAINPFGVNDFFLNTLDLIVIKFNKTGEKTSQ